MQRPPEYHKSLEMEHYQLFWIKESYKCFKKGISYEQKQISNNKRPTLIKNVF